MESLPFARLSGLAACAGGCPAHGRMCARFCALGPRCPVSSRLPAAGPPGPFLQPPVPWAHIVPCPPGSLQWVHPGPSCSLRPVWPARHRAGAGLDSPILCRCLGKPSSRPQDSAQFGQGRPTGRGHCGGQGFAPPDPRFKDTLSPVGPWCKLQGTADPRGGVHPPVPTRWHGPCTGHVWLSPGPSGRGPWGTEFRLRTWA